MTRQVLDNVANILQKIYGDLDDRLPATGNDNTKHAVLRHAQSTLRTLLRRVEGPDAKSEIGSLAVTLGHLSADLETVRERGIAKVLDAIIVSLILSL